MALIFMDGFDKYGGVNSNNAGVATLLTAGEWNSIAGSSTIVTPLSATGQALSLASGATLSKTMTLGRIIGGMRFSSSLSNSAGIQFLDGASNQFGILINFTGAIQLRNGSYNSGTIIATSAGSITASSVHYLEWDITLGNTAAYQVWLDGVSLFNGVGDTTTTANNTFNNFQIISNTTLIIDDLYLFDATGTANNAVLLSSPRIETQFPTSDGAVQFAVGAGILGSSVSRSNGNLSTSANQLRLRLVIPQASCTINSISFLAGSSAYPAMQIRPVVYADTGTVAGTLLGSGSTVTGTVIGTIKTMPLTTGIALTGGTRYWIGYHCDISGTNALQQLSLAADDYTGTATFASGAPSTAPTMTAGTNSVLWGNVTGVPNWSAANQNPTQGAFSYVYDATVGHEDLYSFPALSAPPSAIYAVAVKASLSKSDAGAKTASVRMKSSTTDSAGSGGTALAPATSYGWMTSNFPTDPATSAAWTLGGLNSAQAGVKVET